MSSGGRIGLEVADGLAVVTVDHPARRNALTLAMAEQMHAACDRIASDAAIGAVLLRGAAGTFCSGLDTEVIAVQRSDPAGSEALRRSSLVYGAFTRVGELPVPTFAAVRGAAVGAGLNLALAADLRIVARDARLLAGFTRLGLHPGGGFFTLATRLVGREAAVALGVAGEELDGERAAALGFAWRAVDDADVEGLAETLARRCAADPELARATIASLRAQAGPPGLPWPAAVELERGRQMWTFRRLAEREAGGA